jgi:hypothetical protein
LFLKNGIFSEMWYLTYIFILKFEIKLTQCINMGTDTPKWTIQRHGKKLVTNSHTSVTITCNTEIILKNTHALVYVLLGISPASDCVLPLKMDLREGSETSEKHNLTPGKYPKEHIQHSKHGESLKSRILKHLIVYLHTANIRIGDYNKYTHMTYKITPLSIKVQYSNYKR